MENPSGIVEIIGTWLIGFPDGFDLAWMNGRFGEKPAVDVFLKLPLQGGEITDSITNRSAESDALRAKGLQKAINDRSHRSLVDRPVSGSTQSSQKREQIVGSDSRPGYLRRVCGARQGKVSPPAGVKCVAGLEYGDDRMKPEAHLDPLMDCRGAGFRQDEASDLVHGKVFEHPTQCFRIGRSDINGSPDVPQLIQCSPEGVCS